MEQISKKTFFSFAIMDSLYWAFYACFVGFITTYLLTCGMDNAVLSIMLAWFMGASFIGAFFWGGICDKARTNKILCFNWKGEKIKKYLFQNILLQS